jgi:hypothetical protein
MISFEEQDWFRTTQTFSQEKVFAVRAVSSIFKCQQVRNQSEYCRITTILPIFSAKSITRRKKSEFQRTAQIADLIFVQ